MKLSKHSIAQRLWLMGVLALLVTAGTSAWILLRNIDQQTRMLMDANLVQYANSIEMFERYIRAQGLASDVYDPRFHDDFAPPSLQLDSDTLSWWDKFWPSSRQDKPPLFRNESAVEQAQDSPMLQDYNLSYALVFQIWDTGGDKLVLRSSNAPTIPMRPLSDQQQGLTYLNDGQHTWRLYTSRNVLAHRVIFVAHEQNHLAGVVNQVAQHILTPLLVGCVVIVLLWLWVVRVSFAPLLNLTRAIGQRSALNLTPINEPDTPLEMTGAVQALNRLMEQLGLSLSHERQFTANAAHELRTPLAVIDTLTQTAIRSQDLNLLPKIKTATDKAHAQIVQLLSLARVDAQMGLNHPEAVDLHAIAQDVCADLLNVHGQEGAQLAIECDEQAGACLILSNPELCYSLIKNLVENAIIHAQAQPKHITIALSRTAGAGVQLSVVDNGANVSALTMDKLTARFYRGRSDEASQSRTGMGIGLSIVEKICTLHHARLSIGARHDGLAGLRVVVVFPESGL